MKFFWSSMRHSTAEPYTGCPKKYGHILIVYNLKTDKLKKFSLISPKSVSSTIFLKHFCKTVNPSFNGLTGIHSCWIYFTRDAKKRHTKLIWELSSFIILLKMAFQLILIFIVDSLSLIYSELWRLQIHEFQGNLKKMVQICEFSTAINQNISNLESQTYKSKLLRMPFSVREGSLTVVR